MLARGVSKSGHLPDGPDSGEARPAWGTVPECNTGNPPTTPKIDGGCHFNPFDGASRRLAWTTTGKWTRTCAPSLRTHDRRGDFVCGVDTPHGCTEALW
ncbi:MAG: hypothetical protein PWR07_1870 [Bacillota bacterium]|nr:hypothetical protein [Bacillota bacterium]